MRYDEISSSSIWAASAMRLLSIRLIVFLIVGITLVSLSSSYYEAFREKRALRRDLERRAEVLGESLAGNVERDLEKNSVQDLQSIVQHFGNREHLSGLAIYGRQGDLLAVTRALASTLTTVPSVMSQALRDNHGVGAFQRVDDTSVHMYALPLCQLDEVIGGLVIVHDASYIRAESLHIWREAFLRALAHVFLIVLITLLIIRWSIAAPIARTAEGQPFNQRPRLGLVLESGTLFGLISPLATLLRQHSTPFVSSLPAIPD